MITAQPDQKQTSTSLRKKIAETKQHALGRFQHPSYASTLKAAAKNIEKHYFSRTDAEEVVADLYGVAAAIASVGNYLPTHLIVSPQSWAKLGSLVDQQGRPVFPQTAPINGIGRA